MAVTIAPLTTVVMNSVKQDRVGAASGINNTVARVAGVLAIAILGIVMVKVFSARLNFSLDNLSLTPSVLQQLHAGENKLAALPVPADIDPASQAAVIIKQSISKAFICGFRIVMLICAGLSLASSAVASRMIRTDSNGIE